VEVGSGGNIELNLRLLTELATDEWTPAKNERLAAHPDQAFNLVRSK